MNLSSDDFRQLYVPVGFAHGFCVLSEAADIEYKCTDYYDPAGEGGLRWDDPFVGIDWPVSRPYSLAPRRRAPPVRPKSPGFALDLTRRHSQLGDSPASVCTLSVSHPIPKAALDH